MTTRKPKPRRPRTVKIRSEFLNNRAGADWITDQEAALICGVHWTTIWQWSKSADKTGFPQPTRRGRKCTRWNRAAVEAWMAGGTEITARERPGKAA